MRPMFWCALAFGCADADPVPLTDPTQDAPTAPAPDPGWRTGAPLPGPQQECGVVALDGLVYVVGGFDAGIAMLDAVRVYDPAADGWSEAAPLPRPVHHANVAVVDGRIHVAGALVEGFLEIGAHWAYDPAADVWEERAPLPAGRAVGGAGAAVVGGRLHLIGGLRATRAVALHSAYDPGTDAWEALPDAPSARDHLAMGAVGDTLVVTAGRARDLDAFVAATERWTEAGGWSAGTPIPTPRGGVAAAVDPDGGLHVLGGEGSPSHPGGVFPTHERYDAATDTWSAEGPLATPRHGTGAAWVDGTVWLPGGAPVEAFGAVAVNEGWTP